MAETPVLDHPGPPEAPDAAPATAGPGRPGIRVRSARQRERRSRWLRRGLRLVAVVYLILLVGWPVLLVAQRALENGAGELVDLFTDRQVSHAIRLTVVVALASLVINTVFGVGVSILLVRYEFPGKRLLSALLDLPLSVSPIVVGLSLLLVYSGRTGWLGPTLEDLGFKVIFAAPGMIMATVFVALPLMVREVVPILQEVGTEQEQAARSLGANAWARFRRITLPSIKWAVIYGMVLTLARSLGEFGAVKVVSGNVAGRTRTATLVVEEKYLNFDQAGAYATAFLLALISVAAIVIVTIVRPREHG